MAREAICPCWPAPCLTPGSFWPGPGPCLGYLAPLPHVNFPQQTQIGFFQEASTNKLIPAPNLLSSIFKVLCGGACLCDPLKLSCARVWHGEGDWAEDRAGGEVAARTGRGWQRWRGLRFGRRRRVFESTEWEQARADTEAGVRSTREGPRGRVG